MAATRTTLDLVKASVNCLLVDAPPVGLTGVNVIHRLTIGVAGADLGSRA